MFRGFSQLPHITEVTERVLQFFFFLGSACFHVITWFAVNVCGFRKSARYVFKPTAAYSHTSQTILWTTKRVFPLPTVSLYIDIRAKRWATTRKKSTQNPSSFKKKPLAYEKHSVCVCVWTKRNHFAGGCFVVFFTSPTP